MTLYKSLFAGLGLAACTFMMPHAQAMPAGEFAQCIANIDALARTEGISDDTLTNSLAKVSYSERVIELDRQQPEFTTTFADYFGRRVNEQRVTQGRALLEKHGPLLNRIAQEYGVPAPYLVAFWGLETNFGSFFGRMSVLDSLATLACDPRRSRYFTRELISALRIIDEGSITAERMEGSWAGAMGHVQFMPSVFLRYAVDYDESGQRDLWNSLPDAMASAANFLKHLGWDDSTRWGREVRLPDNFPFMEAGLDTRKPVNEWAKQGVRQADGSALPNADIQASLLIPAGHQGPAFLVYNNFRVIMGWNQSEFYALSVGHLADRIAGAGKLVQAPPSDAPRLSRDQVIALQKTLHDKGYDSGVVDGILGPATRSALRNFQHSQELVPDGFPGLEVLTLLGIQVSD